MGRGVVLREWGGWGKSGGDWEKSEARGRVLGEKGLMERD